MMSNDPTDSNGIRGTDPEANETDPAAGAENETADTAPPVDGPESAAGADSVARERDDYLDKWQRERASFVNYKRWVEKERRHWEAAAACRLVEKLLPFIDDVDRALLASREASEVEALREGFQLIASSFQQALGRAGVEEIPADGEAFDPRIHEAVFQVEDPDRPHGTVTETTQRGFRLGERLIRASKVVVSRAPQAAAEEPSNEEQSSSGSEDEESDPDAGRTPGSNEEG